VKKKGLGRILPAVVLAACSGASSDKSASAEGDAAAASQNGPAEGGRGGDGGSSNQNGGGDSGPDAAEAVDALSDGRPGGDGSADGGATGSCGAAPPITMPSNPCSVTSFGAVADGTTDNAAAIQNAFNAAKSSQCTVLIPAGTFAYSGTLTADGIAITGVGAASILKALDAGNEALTMTGSGGSVSNLHLEGTGTARLTTYQSAMIWINGAQNFTVRNMLIDGGSCVGIYDAGGQNGVIENNTVENTLADSITNTNGASGIIVRQNRVINSGDDDFSNNSYNGDGNTVHDITVEWNTAIGNANGRGLEVSGGSNITFNENYVDNTDGYADVYISSESEWNTQSVSQVTVSGNTLVDSGPNQGSIIVYNSEPGSQTISNVTIQVNQIVSPAWIPVQIAGSGVETSVLVNNNTAYFSGQFSVTQNSAASPTFNNNAVMAPSSYSAPAVLPGGGCNFAGCSGTSAKSGPVTVGDCSM
jgi:hypothetical protein